MNTQWKTKLILLTAMCGLLACNKVNFSQLPEETQQAAALPPIVQDTNPIVAPVVVTPPVVIPPVVVVEPPPVVTPPVAKLSSGDCADNSGTQLLSCLKCEAPPVPVVRQFSEKGLALIDGLALGCSVRNGSDPIGYVPPTREQLVARLNRASPTLYPDSTMSTIQNSVISGLVSATDDTMRKRIFGGLFYRPPYSDAFETYFGLSVAEARYAFCYDNPSSNFTMSNSTSLVSKAYMDCTFGAGNCKESPEYVLANVFRNQLRNTMKQSISSPYVAPAPTPAKKCKWEKYEGDYDSIAQNKIRQWLSNNYSVGMTIDTLAGRCESVTGVDSTLRGQVVISGYICQ